MVPLTDRRHRLNPEEVDPVKEAVHLYLEQLSSHRAPEDLPHAETAFRVLYRLHIHQPGRPRYPEPITWDTIAALLNNGTISTGEGNGAKMNHGGGHPERENT